MQINRLDKKDAPSSKCAPVLNMQWYGNLFASLNSFPCFNYYAKLSGFYPQLLTKHPDKQTTIKCIPKVCSSELWEFMPVLHLVALVIVLLLLKRDWRKSVVWRLVENVPVTSLVWSCLLSLILWPGSQQQPSIAVLLWLSLQQLTGFTASLWPSIKTSLHTLHPITLAGMKDETDEYGGQKVHKPSPRLNQDVYITGVTHSARINKQLRKGLNVLWY